MSQLSTFCQALPQQIPGSLRAAAAYPGLDNYQMAQAMMQSGDSLARGAGLGQSLGGSLGFQPPDHAAAAASLAANHAFQQQSLMSGGSGSFHTAHSGSGLLPVGSLEALRQTWQVSALHISQHAVPMIQRTKDSTRPNLVRWDPPGERFASAAVRMNQKCSETFVHAGKCCAALYTTVPSHPRAYLLPEHTGNPSQMLHQIHSNL